MKRRDNGYAIVRNLAHDGRLIIKDTNNGSSLNYADMLITYYKDKYPDRRIVYILDNFHKLQEFSSMVDERSRFKKMSTSMKTLVTRHHITAITTDNRSVFFAYRESVALGKLIQFRGTVKRHADRGTQLNRVKITQQEAV
jgi:hypothetical protein